MNKELLFQLYSIHSESGREKKMRRFLRKKAFECGATSVETDSHGNLLIVKGESETYPCLAAHMDQVQDRHSKDFRCVQIGDDVIGWSPKSHEQQGLGADDKNGLFICLELLRKFDAIKVAFFVGEEVGCKGSSKVDLGFFKDCRFIVEPDRKGSSDLITSMFCGEVCSEDFQKAIGYKEYGYKPAVGSITDVGELVERGVGISCLNLSCGYYHAHSDEEITILSDLENCMDFVEHIVETCKEVYPFEGGYGGYGKGFGRYGHYYLDDWYGYDKDCVFPKIGAAKKQEEEEDDYESVYYDEGYFDEDTTLMSDLLRTDPSLTQLQVIYSWLDYFHAPTFYGREAAEDIIGMIYDDVKNADDYHWWEDEDDEIVKAS